MVLSNILILYVYTKYIEESEKKYGQECYAHKKRYRTVAFIPDKSYL